MSPVVIGRLASRPDLVKIYEIKNKIVEVWAAARVIVQTYGHTKKFAKHVIALVVKQEQGLKTDIKLVEFLAKDPIGKHLGYKNRPDETTFSKVRERMDPQMMEDLQLWIVSNLLKGRQVRLIAHDSIDMPAFFTKKDREAQLSHRTQKCREQQLSGMVGRDKKEKASVLGYKLQLVYGCKIGLPLTGVVKIANIHDSRPFDELFPYVVDNFNVQYGAKFLSDCAYDSAHIRKTVRETNGMEDVIAINGRGNYRSKTPKDDDYGNRGFVEQSNSIL